LIHTINSLKGRGKWLFLKVSTAGSLLLLHPHPHSE
jgi:hypothetical protein